MKEGLLPQIIEAEWNGGPTFLIGYLNEKGEPFRVLHFIDPIPPANCFWLSRAEMGWHSPKRSDAEDALKKVLEILEEKRS